MARREFPQSVSLGARGVGWIDAEIDEWIESRIVKTRSEDYSPADKMPKSIRERHRNGTILTR
jgi:hypothetical protein